jgi:hypothetical protein
LGFINKLYQNSLGEVKLIVFLKINGQKILAEERALQSTLFTNISSFIIEKPSTIDLSNVSLSNLNTGQILSWNGINWINVNATLADYSVLTGPNTYSFVNRSSYSFIADSANYADTVIYADTILYDLSMFGNSGEINIGTLTNEDFIIKTNSTERFRITSNGTVSLNQNVSDASISISANKKGVLSENQLGNGQFPSISSNSLMLWYPNNSAFRIGEFSGTSTEEQNLGDFSFAFGKNSIASGLSSSTAFGEECIVEQIPSFGLADNFYTNGSSAFAFGYKSEARGIYSFAFGYESRANFYRSIAIGYQCSIDSISTSSIALGYRAKIITPISTGLVAIGYNVLVNADKSTALGSYASSDKKRNSFVYGDNSSTNYVSNTQENQFMARASGGVSFYTSSDLSSGSVLPSGSGSWSSLSDKKSKKNIKKLNPEHYLPLLMDLTIYEWEYISEPSVTHIGIISQDFYRVFGLGSSNKHISMVDADGVTFLMLKGLNTRYKKIEEHTCKLNRTTPEIDFSDIEQRITKLEQKLNNYEN